MPQQDSPLGYNSMKWVRAIAGVTVATGVVFGWKVYSKFKMAQHTQQALLTACVQDRQCGAAVNQHFQYCFDAHYDWGSRYQARSLNGLNFIRCINDKADQPYFKPPPIP